MMNADYRRLAGADAADRQDLFVSASRRLGTAPQNIEKDFWVCWTLDVLFNGLAAGGPRFLFKGGTSLSKGFGLIERFSEDIDITVFRDDLGEDASVAQLEAMSGKKRQAKLDAIKVACQQFIGGPLLAQLSMVVAELVEETGATDSDARVELDPDDESQQSLLLWYPSITEASEGYIRKAVKIESGAKSALDPHRSHLITPYLADDIEDFELGIDNVTIVDAERTFWDKVVILHGLRRWFDIRGVLRAGGQRVSRHYYDVHLLMGADTGTAALADPTLGADCVAHARMFFNSRDLDLAHAEPGSFALVPNEAMIAELRRDYTAMAGMIFGTIPSFDDVLATVAALEASLNGSA
ncbi:nucleotidyl transferase AbiEii/AbiGii toxin family protein [Sphingomonas aerolata]|uniref:nucleotidyl transferase AbiEii/AbiGii toxin family protein n=1 Tax=Sphingomonas aerolata TaxID=185951 RepID=UPI0035A72335